jgi:DNA-binding IclR family transcriptional regulator
VQSEGPVAITHRPGSQTYLHSTAMGKALLAEMQNDKIRVLLDTRPLPRLTPRTTVTLPQLIKEIETVRRLGYATSEEENRQGFFSAGAVVRDVSGAAIAVISGAVPTVTMKANDRSPIARQVIEAARNAAMEPPTFQRNAFVLRLQSRLN